MSKAFRGCLLLLAALVLMGLVDAAFGQEKVLRVAAAADLTPVMPTLAAAYEHATGVKVMASFGSSATLEQQLENGDPQDVFLSADFTHPEALVAAGKTVESTPVAYARGVLVLWARKDSPAQPLGLDSLTRPGVEKIAVANDQHAPYGVAATRAIAALHLTDKLQGKLVVAENIAQTAEFVESGNAQVGFISLTTATSPKFAAEGTFVRVPAVYPPIEQCGVVLKGAKNEGVGVDFLHWLTSKDVQATLGRMGLEPVNGPK
jgi:molybdate transport system substrate-binding protein